MEKVQGCPPSQVFALTTTNFAQGVMLTLPFTIAVYMVRSFLAGDEGSLPDEQEVGRLTGLLAALYSFSQFTTSYAWGVVSNKIGRKPILVLGSAVSAGGLLWFGMAGSYRMASAARMLAGFLNGIIVAWKCMLGESCDTLRQGIVMSYMGLAWGLGCIAGPSIGGIGSQPCNRWPHAPGCKPDGLLQNRPYFLPCAIAAVINVISLFLNMFVLEETLPAILSARESRCHVEPRRTVAASAHVQVYQHVQQHVDEDACNVQASQTRLWSRLHHLCRQLPGFRVGSVSYQRLDSLSSCASAADASASKDTEQALRHCPGSASSIELSLTGQGCKPGMTPGSLGSASSITTCDKSPSGFWSTLGRFFSQRPMRWYSNKLLHSYKTIDSSTSQQESSRACQNHVVDIPASSQGGAEAKRSQDSIHQLQSEAVPLGIANSRQGPAENQQNASIELSAARLSPQDSVIEWASQGRQQQGMKSDLLVLVKQGPAGGGDSKHALTAGAVTIEGENAEAAQTGPFSHRTQQLEAAPVVSEAQGSSVSPSSAKVASADASQGVGSSGAVSPPWYKQKQVVLSLAGYGLTAFLFCALDEVTPIFASAPIEQGGLDLEEVELAGPLAFGGLSLMAISLFVFPVLQRAWGTLALTRCGMLLAALVSVAIPCTRFAVGADAQQQGIGWAAWLILYGSMLGKAGAGSFAFTGAMIMVNKFAIPSQLGHVNGVGQSLASLARGVGPALGGVMWGVTVQLRLPGAQLLPYLLVAVVSLIGWVLYCFVQQAGGAESLHSDDKKHMASCSCE